MLSETAVILGIPVDNLTMDEAVDSIFDMIEAYRHDKRPRQVATVNVDFVVNTLTWRLGRSRHPELLDILRRADVVTADGMPLVVVSKLLGSPLKGRVTGADLVPRLAKDAAQRGKSLYFLGGRETVAKRAAALLQQRYPSLVIAGIDSPFVYTEGKNLADAEDVDREIIERINAARPDILLIAFGNPKQEVWFNRNRNRLRVPVSIGVGGTFEFIAGSVKRAPAWMQRTGMEWIFRITQDPGRLWKRYLLGFFKFGLMVWPAVLYYRYQLLGHRLLRTKGALPPEAPGDPGAPATTHLTIVALPSRLDLAALEGVSEGVDQAFAGGADIALDFGQVSFVDSRGLGFLIRTLRRGEREGREVYLLRVAPKARRFFELNRTWDLFRERAWDQLDEVRTQKGERPRLPPFACIMTHNPEFVLLDLLGRLDAQQMAAMDVGALLKAIANRHCILNLGRLNFVDSSGLIFFFKIQKRLVNTGNQCVLCALTDNVKQLFRLTKLDQLFRIAPDLATAQQMLKEPA
jgi:N-acetylglucosaminyldiphosphoundecaprenol N-acetyl-beta-D-mannosaminyltransferase